MPSYSDKSRFSRAIDKLIADGIVWEDAQNSSEIAYWFPSLMKNEESTDSADLALIGAN